MINAKDLILLAAILTSMLVAVIWPDACIPFRPYTAYFLMAMLFLSFLPISFGSIAKAAYHSGLRLPGWLLFKLVILPVALFFLFRAIYPEYAMAALLLGGICTGVVAPFFSTLVGGSTELVVIMVVASSILVPFTLPVLVRVFAGHTMDISLQSMATTLALVIFIPLTGAAIVRRVSLSIAERIVAQKYPLSLLFCVLIMLAVFSKYADHIHRNPSIVASALLVSIVLSALLFAAGILVSLKQSAPERLAVVISLGLPNNILVVVFGSQFFGPVEPLVGMIYCVPFFCSIVFLRIFSRWLTERAAE